jgi:hypothetical protein
MPTTAPLRRRPAARRLRLAALAAAAGCSAVVVAAPPAAAAPSCAGTVISAQGTSGPRVVSDRVHEIQRVIIPEVAPGATFGSVISRGLAQADC